MKDFYDIIFIAGNNSFALLNLKMAIDTTFSQRKTDINRRFYIYNPHYAAEKEKLWKPFLKKIGNDNNTEFHQVIKRMKDFIEPVITSKNSENNIFWDSKSWQWIKKVKAE